MLLRGLIDKLLFFKEHHVESTKQEYKEDFNVVPRSEVEDVTDIIEQAKSICITKLLIPFEGEPMTKDGKFLAYKDPASIDGLPITIAWGLTYHADGTLVKLGEIWEYDYAVKVKAAVLSEFINGVIELCPDLVNEHPNKLAAITSFAYNVGLGNLSKSTLRKKINNKDYSSVPQELLKWNRASGKVMNGLTRRRKAEGELFSRV